MVYQASHYTDPSAVSNAYVEPDDAAPGTSLQQFTSQPLPALPPYRPSEEDAYFTPLAYSQVSYRASSHFMLLIC